MRVIVASVLSHLVVRPRRFWERKEKKKKMKINNDLAIVASQYLKGRFMTLVPDTSQSMHLTIVTTCSCST